MIGNGRFSCFPEFGRSVHNFEMEDCDVESGCFMMRSTGLHFRMYVGIIALSDYFYHTE